MAQREARGIDGGYVRRRRVRYRIAAVVLGFGVALGIPELIVRVVDPDVLQYRTILFGKDPSSARLFVKDAWLHWRLRPSVALDFMGVSVRTDSHGLRGTAPGAADRTVLCLGDSTTFGWRVGEDATFAARLERLLNERSPLAASWRVLNAGVPGYTSHQVLQVAERLIPEWRPDWVVLNIGNNEAWPAERSDREVTNSERASARVRSLLWRSRFLTWVAERIRPEEPRPFDASEVAGSVARVPLDEFVVNVARIVDLARQHDAALLVVSPTVNLNYPPLGLGEPSGRETPETDWNALWEALERGEVERVLAGVDAALARSPDRYEYLWLRGAALKMRGDLGGGDRVFEEVFERLPFPRRARRSYRDALAGLCRRRGVPYLDANAVFQGATRSGTTNQWFIDSCHPTAEGHVLLARAIADRIAAESRSQDASAR